MKKKNSEMNEKQRKLMLSFAFWAMWESDEQKGKCCFWSATKEIWTKVFLVCTDMIHCFHICSGFCDSFSKLSFPSIFFPLSFGASLSCIMSVVLVGLNETFILCGVLQGRAQHACNGSIVSHELTLQFCSAVLWHSCMRQFSKL